MRNRNILRLAEGPVLVEQLRLVLGNVSSSAISAFFVAILFGWVLSNDSNAQTIKMWCATVILSKLSSAWYARRTLAADISCEHSHRLVWILMALHTVEGVAWGALAWITLDTASVAESVLVVAAMAAIAGSSMSAFSPVLPVYLVFSASIMLTLAAKLWQIGNPAYRTMGTLAALYVPMLFMQVRSSAEAARAAINLRFENVELVEEARKARREAEQANLAKSKFLAAASHDLRQPIHAQGMFLEVLAKSGLNAEQNEVLKNVRAASEASAEMLNTLLDFSRLEAGVVEPQARPFHLQPLLNKIEKELAPQANAKGLVFRLRDTRAAVHSDPALVEMILRNLVSNAIRYTECGGVLVACRARGDQILLEVWDTGIGIEPSQQQEIFREFHQLGNQERDRNKGLGLGLAIANGLALTLGSELTLASTPGCGSVFRLALPTTQAALVSDGLESTAIPLRRLDARVLVIDDDAAVREGMLHLLRSWACECEAVEFIEEALVAARANRPDVVISDYRLREQRTGAEAIAALRAEFGADLPALLITGDTAPERLRETLASGVPLLHKPVSPSLLHHRLSGMLTAAKAAYTARQRGLVG